MAYAIVSALSNQGIQVTVFYENEMLKLSGSCPGLEFAVSKVFSEKIWIVGKGLTKVEQLKAPNGTIFIPYSHFPPEKARKDAFYGHTPSMIAPATLRNLHSCENWLPRRMMSASRIAGILHALEGWNVNECGQDIFNHNKIWEAALKHGFRPTSSFTCGY